MDTHTGQAFPGGGKGQGEVVAMPEGWSTCLWLEEPVQALILALRAGANPARREDPTVLLSSELGMGGCKEQKELVTMVVLSDHSIIEYSELAGTHQDH